MNARTFSALKWAEEATRRDFDIVVISEADRLIVSSRYNGKDAGKIITDKTTREEVDKWVEEAKANIYGGN